MNAEKRGQVTLFIILAMVIVIILAVVFYVVSRTSSSLGSYEEDKAFVDGQIGSVRAFVVKCVEKQVSSDVKLLLQNGGKSAIEPIARPYQGASVNYLLYDGTNNMNLRSEIGRRISLQVEEKLKNDCSLSSFKEVNPKPEIRRMEVDTLILDDSVRVDLTYPITLKKGSYQTTIEDFQINVLTDFGRLYRTADTIISQEVQGGAFDVVEYTTLFPEIRTKKDALSAKEHVYVISTEEGDEFLIFATKLP